MNWLEMSISRGKYIVLGEVNIVCTALRRDLQKLKSKISKSVDLKFQVFETINIIRIQLSLKFLFTILKILFC